MIERIFQTLGLLTWRKWPKGWRNNTDFFFFFYVSDFKRAVFGNDVLGLSKDPLPWLFVFFFFNLVYKHLLQDNEIWDQSGSRFLTSAMQVDPWENYVVSPTTIFSVKWEICCLTQKNPSYCWVLGNIIDSSASLSLSFCLSCRAEVAD